MLQDREWTEVARAIRKAANITTDAWDDDEEMIRWFRMTRHTLEPQWIQYAITQAQLRELPHPGVIHDELRSMFEQLFQPIIDLDWENYFYEEKPDWQLTLFNHGLISVNEFRELQGLPQVEGIIDATRTGRTPGESEGPTSTG